jgi:saccharopine dehydrogenase-like NADP-dependent oxidoreductase
MKILILGGAGDMGSYMVRDAVKFGTTWTEITIADIEDKRANKLIEELGDSRLNYTQVDATNHDDLVSLMKKYDVACSAIGPFYIFGPKVARAAIEARVPLVDICDDAGPTLEILEMDEAANAANIPILMGYGWTPGLTNLMAKHAYSKLDRGQPVEFDISWVGGAADSEGLAVIMHVLYATTGTFPSYQNDRPVEVPAGGGNVKLDFPEPIGTVSISDCGHPEPVTIPKFLPDVKKCTLKGGLTPDWNNKLVETFKQLHLTQGKSRKKYLARGVHRVEGLFATGGIAASSARVDIRGTFQGKPVHWVYSTPSIIMGELTGIPASIAAQFVAEGKITGSGVLPPERLPDDTPKMFFEELKKRNIEMIFDEQKPLNIFTPAQAYTPGIGSKYGMTLVCVIILGMIVVGLWYVIQWTHSLLFGF